MSGVEELGATRQPYQDVRSRLCPACNNSIWFDIEYRTTAYAKGYGKEKHIIEAFGAPSDPHLVITCQNCGFWWEMEVARP